MNLSTIYNNKPVKQIPKITTLDELKMMFKNGSIIIGTPALNSNTVRGVSSAFYVEDVWITDRLRSAIRS